MFCLLSVQHCSPRSPAAANIDCSPVLNCRNLCPALYQHYNSVFSPALEVPGNCHLSHHTTNTAPVHSQSAADLGRPWPGTGTSAGCRTPNSTAHSISCSIPLKQATTNIVNRTLQPIANERQYAISSCSRTNAAVVSSDWPNSGGIQPQCTNATDVEDTLKLAALIRRFRSRGHLVAQLDPLKRTAGGPWLGPIGDEGYTRLASDRGLDLFATSCSEAQNYSCCLVCGLHGAASALEAVWYALA